MTISPADLIAGMAKGMAVLESFDTQRQRLNATLAAQRAGITRAAARRHLLTLAHLGYLETDGGHFWLSAKVLRFSGSYLASARLPRVVQPALNHLAALTGESFSVVLLDGSHDWLTPALGSPPPVRTRVKADRDCASVAAASVLAKVHRDRLMIAADAEHPGYAWASNKGYGSAAHYAGLSELGPSPLHRVTWLRD